MAGYAGPGPPGPCRLARPHRAGTAARSPPARPNRQVPSGRAEREELEDSLLAPGATRSSGAGDRAEAEQPDPWRTCFERDRDRILHATSFRRLAGKTQVFVFPQDHQRTRLTHALEVAQVATAIARACRLNVALTEAIALGHDCGHGPGGHASEDALDPYVPGGFDHAPVGGAGLPGPPQPVRRDGRRHRQPQLVAPGAVDPRGRGGQLGRPDRLRLPRLGGRRARPASWRRTSCPPAVRALCGERRSAQLGAFITGVVSATLRTGQVGMEEEEAEALAAFRACNYERIYLRDASLRQGDAVISVLRALVEHFSDRPHLITDHGRRAARAVRRRRRQPGRGAGRRHLRRRHDRPLRLPPGGGAPRLGPGQAPGRRRRLTAGAGLRPGESGKAGGRFSVSAATPSAKSAPRIISAMRDAGVVDRRRDVAVQVAVELQLGRRQRRRRDLRGELPA